MQPAPKATSTPSTFTPRSLTSTFADYEGLSRELGHGLLFDDSTADIWLCVQGVRLAGHRAILGARSPVFRAMFYGSMKESSADAVEVNSFEAKTMRLLLRYMYSGNVENVDLEEMVPLMACADHFGVITLRDAIGNHLTDSISLETACTVLVLARQYQQDRIVERYLSFILTHAQQVMQTETFLHLDKHVLLKVLEADEARIEEIDLFKALVRWYRQWAREEDTLPADEVEKLFGSIRYGQMTGQQLVTEVRPLAGDIVPQDLYVTALEQVAAPGIAAMNESHMKQCVRRQPPIGSISISDALLLNVQSTTVRKVGIAGWNCTAVVEPSTSRTRFTVGHLADPQNGVGIAIFDPERNALRGGSCGFPNPNQWGADCIVGLYGTGCFFGIITDHVVRWHIGLVVEVTMRPAQNGAIHVAFTTGGVDGERISAEGILTVPPGVRLAVALHGHDDQVAVESFW